MKVVRPHEWRRMPWRNGGGILHEIVSSPERPSVAEDADYRISIAEIGRSGPFSSYPGCDRTITLIEGPGFTLDLGSEGSAKVERPYTPLRLKGAPPPTCTLRDGPVRVFNVITAHRSASHAVRVVHVTHQRTDLGIRGDRVVLLSLAGSVLCSFGPHEVQLGTWDAVHAERAALAGPVDALALSSNAVVAVVDMRVGAVTQEHD